MSFRPAVSLVVSAAALAGCNLVTPALAGLGPGGASAPPVQASPSAPAAAPTAPAAPAASPTALPTAAAPAVDAVLGPSMSYRSAKHGFALRYPASWNVTIRDDDAPDGKVHFQAGARDTGENVTVAVGPSKAPPGASLEDVAAAARTQGLQAEIVEIGGRLALRSVHRSKDLALPATALLYQFVSADRLYTLGLTASPAHFERRMAVLEAVAASFDPGVPLLARKSAPIQAPIAETGDLGGDDGWFPLIEGGTWVYELSAKIGLNSAEVPRGTATLRMDQVVDGRRKARLTAELVGGEAGQRETASSWQVWTAEGLVSLDLASGRRTLQIRRPIAEGAFWDGDQFSGRRIESTDWFVTTPYRAWNGDVLHVVDNTQPPASISRYYVRDVGLVQVTRLTGDTFEHWRLKTFTRP